MTARPQVIAPAEPRAAPRPEASDRGDIAALTAGFTPPPADPPLAEDTVPYLPRGVRMEKDRVRGLSVLQAPERAMQLDAVGEAILSSLDGRTLGQILDALAEAYAAPREQIAGDVTGFLQGLIDRRMVFVRLP